MGTGTLSNAPHTSSAVGEPQRRWRITLAVVAGVVYSLTWVIGLAIWPSNLDVRASGSAVIAAYTEHHGLALIQYALVEGLAAIALAIVALALGRAARRLGAVTPGAATMALGLGASTVSLIQCALGEALVGWVAPTGDADAAVNIYSLISRLDGVKMMLLAALALVGIGLARRGALPRWLGVEGILLAIALVASGVGYLLLNSTLALAAAVSLPLLLIWVTGAGIALGGINQRLAHGAGRRSERVG